MIQREEVWPTTVHEDARMFGGKYIEFANEKIEDGAKRQNETQKKILNDANITTM